jgi:hypothetical protein
MPKSSCWSIPAERGRIGRRTCSQMIQIFQKIRYYLKIEVFVDKIAEFLQKDIAFSIIPRRHPQPNSTETNFSIKGIQRTTFSSITNSSVNTMKDSTL